MGTTVFQKKPFINPSGVRAPDAKPPSPHFPTPNPPAPCLPCPGKCHQVDPKQVLQETVGGWWGWTSVCPMRHIRNMLGGIP